MKREGNKYFFECPKNFMSKKKKSKKTLEYWNIIAHKSNIIESVFQ